MEVPPVTEPVLTIVGPTASGKSEVALELARRGRGEIVNADALQVYRGFDIGTAKPSPEEQRLVPHHLIDILDPRERYSAGEFARRARTAIAEIQGRGRRPIVVGGSGLYVRALVEGISPIPPGDEEVRETLRRQVEEEGLEGVREELRQLDPETWERLPPGDTQRILRAVEVARVTEEPLSRWIARRPFGSRPLPAVKVALAVPRPLLSRRIEERVRKMVASGWTEEVQRLLNEGVPPEAPAFQAIGYRQLASFLSANVPSTRVHSDTRSCEEREPRGEQHSRNESSPLDGVLEEIIRATRRFAKRQMTWFRKEPDVHWVSSLDLPQRVSDFLSIPALKGFGGSNG